MAVRVSVVAFVLYLCISKQSNGAEVTGRYLSCWTLNVSSTRTSYLYYYRDDPGKFVQMLGSGNSSIRAVSFNASVYVLGAVAADNDDPISLFVHDKISGGIYRFEDNLKSLQPVFRGSSIEVQDIAVDWISHNIYYTDPLVGVGLVSYRKRFAIIIHKVAALHGIDVDPLSRMIFYADGDSGIYQATLTGQNHRKLFEPQATNPTALVVDAVSKVLYWLDEGTQYLQSWNYATSEFKKLWNSYKVGIGVFTGIDLYEQYLFISLKNEQRMMVVLTNGTRLLSFHVSSGTGSVSHGISISTPDRKPHVDSPCQMNNGDCEHICIHKSNNLRECLCQFGYQPDGNGCKLEIAEDNFLLFTDMSSKILYQVDTNTEEFHALYIAAGESSPPENAVYNPQRQTVYWIERDKHQNEIWSMHLMKRIPELLIYLGPNSAIHTIISAEQYIFYTDSQLKRISRINIMNNKTEVVLQLAYEEKPTYLQMDAQNRLYWIDAGSSPKIERVHVNDINSRQVLVSTDLQMPSGLALDLNDDYLYWVDEHLRKIETSKLDGSERELFTVTPDKYHGLALDTTLIYSSSERTLIKIRKEDRYIEKLGPEYFLIASGVSHSSSSRAPTFLLPGGRKIRLFGLDTDRTTLVIIGLTIGGILLIVFIIIVTVACVKQRKKITRTEVNKYSKRGSRDAGVRQSTGSNQYEDINTLSLQTSARNRNATLNAAASDDNINDIVHHYLTMQDIDV